MYSPKIVHISNMDKHVSCELLATEITNQRRQLFIQIPDLTCHNSTTVL